MSPRAIVRARWEARRPAFSKNGGGPTIRWRDCGGHSLKAMSSALINDRTHHLREVLGEGVEVMRQGTLSSSPTHFQAKRFRIDKPADRFAEPINVVVRRHEPFD